MSIVAIIGAGEVGSATAFALARRARVRDVRLVDASAAVAAGKALDMRQTGPIEGFDTFLSGRGDVLDAVTCDLIVIADSVADGDWDGDRGLGLVRQLLRAGTTAPIVFAGANMGWVMEAAVRELGLAPDRIVGSAASAMHSGARGLIGLEVHGSGVDVAVPVVGRPPAFTIGWTSATVGGAPLAAEMPAHRMLAVSDLVKRLWPPKPHAIGAATALIVEGLLFGTRRYVYGTTVLSGEYGERGVSTMLPLVLGDGTVQKRIDPSLSPQERVEFLNGLSRR